MYASDVDSTLCRNYSWLQEVSKDDAEDVVEIMKSALLDACTDEFGVVDFSRAAGMSMAKQVRIYLFGAGCFNLGGNWPNIRFSFVKSLHVKFLRT